MTITDLRRGKALKDGALLELQTAAGPITVAVTRQALSKFPIYTLNLLAASESKTPGASYYSFVSLEARIGQDPNGDVLLLLALPGAKTRLAFQIPAEGILRLKSDIEAVQDSLSTMRRN